MLSLGVGAGLGVWVMYVAVEPYVRRLWPQSIISWTRLVHGRIYDHLVGQSLLAGALTGAFSLPLTYLTRLAPRWLGFAPAQPHYSRRIEAGMLDGPRQALGHMIESGLQGVQWAMLMLVGVVLVKMLVRKTWLALLLFGAAMSFAFTLGQPTLTQDLATSGGGAASAVSTVAHPSLFDSQHLAIFAIIWTLLGIMMLVWLGVLVRYGVLALIAGAAVFSALGSLPITGDFERWYAGIGMMGLGLVCAIPLYGAVAAVGARTRAG
jgi:hypothetical protein